MKTFNGKAIYQPKGKAGEYAAWACNFYVGCSNNCIYCYCKKGVLSSAMGSTFPTLKKCFDDEDTAINVFHKELVKNLKNIQEHGLFFSFSTDPAIKETYNLTIRAINICMEYDVPVKLLTKSKLTGFTIFNWVQLKYHHKYEKLLSVGFTLTGHDELEPGANTNEERLDGMKWIHEDGFKTFASIEPIIDFKSSMKMILEADPYCDLFKIGLESGKKYDKTELTKFVKTILSMKLTGRIYFKDSLLIQACITREQLPEQCVTRNFKLHLHNSY